MGRAAGIGHHLQLDPAATLADYLLPAATDMPQINVNATAVAQAFNGMTYIENVIVNYVTEFVTGREGLMGVPVKIVTRAKFNPNLKSS